MIAKFFKPYWPPVAIIIVIFAFLSNLFFPKLSLFVIPDYGRSDSWSLSTADSFYYAQELKKNNLPIWNPHIGNGYPTFAEGQTGELFPLNVVFFRLFPFALAYDLTLAFTLIIAALGTYFFCRSLKLARLASMFASLIFSLGGFFVFHLQHHALIETASLLPWVFWAAHEFTKSKKIMHLLAVSLFSGLQLLAGFPQLAFYTQFSLFVYLILAMFFGKAYKLTLILAVILAIILGYLLAAIQLIPTYEFLSVSTRVANPGEVLTQFPYTFKNLLQFLNPYILGSPKEGTYPLWQPGKWGIFWENSAYVGILPLILGFGAIIGNVFKAKKNKEIFCLSALLFFATLLALGEQSPIYVIFTIPPFSLFRVPSRFLLPASFALVTLSAIYLNRIKKPIALGLIALSLIDIFIILKNYNPALEAGKLLDYPDSSQFLSSNNAANVYTVGNVNKWNENFVKNGWGDMDKFYFFKNYLDQNSNLIFNIDQFAAYESLQTKRMAFIKSQVAGKVKFENGTYIISDNAIKLLSSSNVSHIISPFEVKATGIQKVFNASKNGNSVNIYKISNTPGIVFLSNNYANAETTQDISQAITGKDFDPINAPVIERGIKSEFAKSTNSNFQIISRSDTSLLINIDAQSNKILTFNQSFYPGWQAYIDGKKVPIFPANINSMAISIPGGSHFIEFYYLPKSLYLGSIVSLISLLTIGFLLLKARSVKLNIAL